MTLAVRLSTGKEADPTSPVEEAPPPLSADGKYVLCSTVLAYARDAFARDSSRRFSALRPAMTLWSSVICASSRLEAIVSRKLKYTQNGI